MFCIKRKFKKIEKDVVFMFKKKYFEKKKRKNALGSLVNCVWFESEYLPRKEECFESVFVLECGVPAGPRTASHQRKWCKRSKVRWQGQG